MAKWQNYSFRATLSGNSGWSGGAITDPQDSDDATNVVLQGTTYGAATALNGLSYGKRSGAGNPSVTDVTPANAGNDPLLGGYHNNSVSSCHYSFGCNPGPYDVRFALGHTSAAANSVAIFDGLFANLVAELGISVHGPKLWQASTAYATSDFVVSPADRHIWDCTTAGTSGTTAPSGGSPGSTYGDGTVIWTKTARQALLLVNNVTNTGGGSNVIDQNGAVVAGTNWQAQSPVSLTVSGDHGNGLTLVRLSDHTFRPRQFGFRAQAANLVDVDLKDQFGEDPGATPSVFAGEAPGLPVLRIRSSYGQPSYSLGGDLASYFTVEAIDGEYWLVAAATRIPDSLAGSRTLNIIQTDPDSLNGTHTTNFTFNVVSSGGRQTAGQFKYVPTGAMLIQQAVEAVYQARPFLGYQGQTIDPSRDFAVTGFSALVSTLSGITPDGTSWYRIRLQNGTYEGHHAGAIRKNFGSGGLLIEPDAGDDPAFNGSFGNLTIRGLHVRDILCPGEESKTGAFYQWRFGDPGPSNGYYTRAIFQNVRAGAMHAAGASRSTVEAEAGNFVFVEHAEQFEVIECDLYGTGSPAILIGSSRLVNLADNDARFITLDLFRINGMYDPESTQGVFADDTCYIRITGNANRDDFDYAGLVSSTHRDWLQISAPNGLKPLYANKGPTGTTSPWVVGNLALNPAVMRIYEVTAVTGAGQAGATLPTGTGTGIVSGDVTFDYVQAYTPSPAKFAIFNNAMNSRSDLATTVRERQFILDSAGDFGHEHDVALFNNIAATPSTYGVRPGVGNWWSSGNSYVGPTRKDSSSLMGEQYFHYNVGTRLLSFRDILGAPPARDSRGADYGGTQPEPATALFRTVYVQFDSGATSLPNDHLRGSFSQDGNGNWVPTSFVDDDTISAAEFVSALSKQYHHETGAAGAKLREVHSVTIEDSGTGSVSRDLVVKP